jgi:hypothetical protein
MSIWPNSVAESSRLATTLPDPRWSLSLPQRHCPCLIASAPGSPRDDLRAAKEIICWFELLDLL